MKIGVCIGTNFENAKLAKEYGYDFVETNCGGIVKEPFENLVALKEIGIPVYSSNCFIGQRVVGPEKDEKAINEYLSELFKRADFLGIRTIVFGSSGARKALENQDHNKCIEEIIYFLSKNVVPFCEKYDIYIAIEPLRKEECNLINTVPQAIEIAKKVNNKYIRVLADVKHMVSSDDSLEKIPEYKDWVIHGHTSNPYPGEKYKEYKRTYPKYDDEFNQDDFIFPLKEAGVEYFSIEADLIDFKTDASESIEILKKYR